MRRFSLVVCGLLAILVCLPVAIADDTFIVAFTGASGDESIRDITVQSRNAYYVLHNPYEILEYADYDLDRSVRLLDSTGSVISEDVFSSPFFAKLDSRIAGIALISREGSAYLTHPVSLCDNDSICEPCPGDGCTSAESHLTCADCPSGSPDRFCDLKDDGVCDNDCDGIDADCELCNSFCFFEDDTEFTCEAIGGALCGPKEDCHGGRFVYSEDAPDTCCLRGVCRNLGEYVETMAELQTMPYLTVTPSGAMGADIYAYGGPDGYCVYGLEGKVCPQGSLCAGDVEEHVIGRFCCHGDCIELADAGSEVVYDFPVEPLTEEEIEEMMGSEDRIDDSYLVDYSTGDHFDVEPEDYGDDLYLMEMEEGIIQELDELERIERQEAFLEYMPRAVQGFSMPLVTVGVLVVLLLLVILIIVFKRSADRKMDAGAQAAAPPQVSAPGAVPVEDLQQAISSLVAKGYSYQQISAMLVRQGHSADQVRSEIMLHYQSRRGQR